jgi:glutathione S-transferase
MPERLIDMLQRLTHRARPPRIAASHRSQALPARLSTIFLVTRKMLWAYLVFSIASCVPTLVSTGPDRPDRPLDKRENRAMKLYYHPLSGHSHRAHLGLSLLGIPHELAQVNLAEAEHKSPEFLKLNPFGQIPVLIDGDAVIADSNAILVYAVRKSGKTDWLPQTPDGEAAVQRWLSVAAGEIAYGPCAARLITVFGRKFDAAEVIERAHRVLGLIDAQLAGRDFIAAATPTIADIALYSYIVNAPEGNVDLSGYPQVGAWLERIEALPGFVAFRQTAAGLRTQQ